MLTFALPVSALLLVLSAWLSSSQAQSATAAQGSGSTASAATQSLEALAFMSGCWRTSAESSRLEENYTAADGNVMLGTSRFWRGGVVVQFEFSRITSDSAGVMLLPFPAGRPSEHAFRLTRAGGDSAVFEAPEHDFPKRIAYSRAPAPDGAALVARIDGGEGSTRVMEWSMNGVACAGTR
jgi:hypothetical protein